jgi:thioredoxin 1
VELGKVLVRAKVLAEGDLTILVRIRPVDTLVFATSKEETMSADNVFDINDFNFDSEVLESKATFVLTLGAKWCGPCKVLVPIIEGIAREHEGRLRVGKLDIDDSPEVAARFGIRAVPTTIAFRNGLEIARHVGVTTRTKLLSMVGAGLPAELTAHG